ncbi:MAG: DUF3108 domain-containing protein [Alphaproteobacteria bacterium]|nr:DUF3108 domain-containing protein [Alphaproteobacteria bacterium]
MLIRFQVAGALVCLAALPAPASEGQALLPPDLPPPLNLVLTYDAYLFGLRAGSFTATMVDDRPSDQRQTQSRSAKQDADDALSATPAYRISIEAQTVGIFKIAYEFNGRIVSAGQIVGNDAAANDPWRFYPEGYSNSVTRGDSARTITANYDRLGPTDWQYRNDPVRYRATDFTEQVAGSSDFASGFVELLSSVNANEDGACHGGKRKMFDGRRIYSMYFVAGPFKRKIPRRKRAIAHQGAFVYCRAVITDRFDMKNNNHKTYSAKGLNSFFFLARPDASVIVPPIEGAIPRVPIYMHIGTPGGDAKAYLVNVAALP